MGAFLSLAAREKGRDRRGEATPSAHKEKFHTEKTGEYTYVLILYGADDPVHRVYAQCAAVRGEKRDSISQEKAAVLSAVFVHCHSLPVRMDGRTAAGGRGGYPDAAHHCEGDGALAGAVYRYLDRLGH